MKNKNIANTLLLAAGSLFLGLLPTQQVVAAPIINYDFEDGLTTGWTTSNTTHPYLSVVNDPLDASNKVLKLDFTYGVVATAYTTFPSLSSGIYTLTLRILVADSGGAHTDYGFDKRISLTDSSSVVATYTRLNVSGTDVVTSGYNGTTPAAGPTVGVNKWYEITQTIDIDNKEWGWSIRDVATNTEINSFSGFDYFGNPGDITRLNIPRVGSSSPSGGLFYLDKVTLTQIPEPASIGMILFSGLLYFASSRRRTRISG